MAGSGPTLAAMGIKVIFTVGGPSARDHLRHLPLQSPRELIPLMQEQGTEEEEAAVSARCRRMADLFCASLCPM